MTAKEFKQFKGLRKESLRDNMSDIEITLADLGEIATREIAKKHKNGKTIEELADEYYLTGYSIRRIIKKVDL